MGMQEPVQSTAQLPVLQPMVGLPEKPVGHVATQLAPGIMLLQPAVGSAALLGRRGSAELGHPAKWW